MRQQNDPELTERLEILSLPDVAGEMMALRRTVLRLESQYSVLNGMYQKTKEDLQAAQRALASMEKRDARYQRFVDFFAKEMGES
jgi:hypothetical protein